MATPGSVPEPFPTEKELCKDLEIGPDNTVITTLSRKCLPGQPSITLDHHEVTCFLEEEFSTPTLNEMSEHLWLLATAKHTHISSLHKQIVRGRQLVVSEDPEMHLVWIHNRVFIKPLPEYLLSHVFWAYYLTPSPNSDPTENTSRVELRSAVLGYLRTWLYLIKHPSDYRIAADAHLIPENTDFGSLLDLLSSLQTIDNHRVSPRYHYGELRLARLNFWIRVWLHKLHFRKVAWQYSDYFSVYYAPLLFAFGILSVSLNAMNLATSTRVEGTWNGLRVTAAWFAVVTLCLVCGIILYIFLDFVFMAGREVVYAFRHRFLRKRDDGKIRERV